MTRKWLLTKRLPPDDDWTRVADGPGAGNSGSVLAAGKYKLRELRDASGKDASLADCAAGEAKLTGGPHCVDQADRILAMSGPFMSDLLKVSMGHGFSFHQLYPERTRGHHSAQALDENDDERNSCFLRKIAVRGLETKSGRQQQGEE